MSWVIIIGVIVLIGLLYPGCTEGLTAKPTDVDRQKYYEEIVNNKHFFEGMGTFYMAKEKMPWLDAIIYEDVRHLTRQNNLNKNSVNRVFH